MKGAGVPGEVLLPFALKAGNVLAKTRNIITSALLNYRLVNANILNG